VGPACGGWGYRAPRCLGLPRPKMPGATAPQDAWGYRAPKMPGAAIALIDLLVVIVGSAHIASAVAAESAVA